MNCQTRLLLSLLAAGLASACASTDPKLERLREENERLRNDLDALMKAVEESGPEALREIPSFTVGLAAAEAEFDESAFEKLLKESLAAAAQTENATVSFENDEREANKVRGMLLEQYLAADEVPIAITNLQFKLEDPENAFKIGGQIVPASEMEVERASSAGAATARHPGPINATMRRDSRGGYAIPYEELGGGSGVVHVRTADLEILERETQPRAERQGDISFNWNLDMAQIAVYRVEGFQGDVGLFLSHMRYSGIETAIGQYQTLRDVVFLFGYGTYSTSLVNQIRTPAHITAVEVTPVPQAVFERLSGRMTEEEVLAAIGESARWQSCTFIDFSGTERVWERPASVPFPFVSRQISGEGEQAFYLKYSPEGSYFIGDYER